MRRVGERKVAASYPGRSVRLSERTRAVERRCEGRAEVSRGHSSPANWDEGPNVVRWRGAKASMSAGGPDKKAERAGAGREASAGSGEGGGTAGQGLTAAKEHSPPGAMGLMEQVVGRENLREALRRVESNQGAPGVDGMAVCALRG